MNPLEVIAKAENIPLKHVYEVLWRRGDLDFLLWAQQIPIWQQLNNLPPHIVEYVVLCARQYGKSTFGVLRGLSQAIKHRDSCILIMGPDTKQIKDIVGPKMRFLCKTAPHGLVRPMKSENRFHVYHDLRSGASDYTEIILGGMNENSSSQRGKTVQEILVEEIVDVNEDDFLTSMNEDLGPALTHSKSGRIIFLTTLPAVPDHPFITDTIPLAQRNGALSVYTIDDNIALTPEQYQACIDRCKGKNTAAFRREYMCEVFRDRNRVCLPDFDEKINVLDFYIPTHLFMHTTIDWGGVRDRTCATLHFHDYLQDLHCFWDCRDFDPNTPTQVIVASTREMEAHWQKEIYNRWVDAPPQTVNVDFINDYNFIASIPEKSDWKAQVNTLNARFQAGKTIIHPRCKFLVLSARSGILNKHKTDFDRNEALGHMDGIAAMMYAERMVSRESPYPRGIENQLMGFQGGINPVYSRDNNERAASQDPFSQGAVAPKGFGRFKR